MFKNFLDVVYSEHPFLVFLFLLISHAFCLSLHSFNQILMPSLCSVYTAGKNGQTIMFFTTEILLLSYFLEVFTFHLSTHVK